MKQKGWLGIAAGMMILAGSCSKTNVKAEEAEDPKKNDPNHAALTIIMEGRQYKFSDAMLHVTVESDGSWGFSFDEPSPSGSRGSVTGNHNIVGSYNWDDDGTAFMFEPSDKQPLAYQSYYDDGLEVSPGFIKITATGRRGDRLVGSFEVARAGATNGNTSAYEGETKISGSFDALIDD
jgi:hypothetical protein